MNMKRIIMHWTAGHHTPNETDRKAYHILIDGNGNEVVGRFPISSTKPPLVSGAYAAHTANLNSYSIGVAVAAMAGAKERPFTPGPSPITEAQVAGLVRSVARLSRMYAIPVSPDTVLTHAEVQPTLGVTQKGKWDITWLPGMASPASPRAVGDMLRARVLRAMEIAHPPAPQLSFWARLIAAIFGRT